MSVRKIERGPQIYQVESVDFETDRECRRWKGQPPKPCQNVATHVFVFEQKIGGNERGNCIACGECTPEVWTLE